LPAARQRSMRAMAYGRRATKCVDRKAGRNDCQLYAGERSFEPTPMTLSLWPFCDALRSHRRLAVSISPHMTHSTAKYEYLVSCLFRPCQGIATDRYAGRASRADKIPHRRIALQSQNSHGLPRQLRTQPEECAGRIYRPRPVAARRRYTG